MSAIEAMLNEVNVESMLALIIDGVLMSSKSYRKATARVTKARGRFEKHLPKSARQHYLDLDDALVARMAVESELLVKWAFAVGLQVVPAGSSRRRRSRTIHG